MIDTLRGLLAITGIRRITRTIAVILPLIASVEPIPAYAGPDQSPSELTDSVGTESREELATVGNFFSCAVPPQWFKQDGAAYSPRAEEMKVYGITLTVASRGEIAPKIDVTYYAPGNLQYRSPQHYLRIFSPLVDENAPYPSGIQNIVVAKKFAWLFERRRNEFLPLRPYISPDHPTPQDDLRVFERRGEIMARRLELRERFVVIPDQQGFYALRFSASEDEYAEFLPAFVQVQGSFSILH